MNPAKASVYSEFSTLITKHIKFCWKKILRKSSCLAVELPEGVWGEHPSTATPEVTMTGLICCGWKMIAGKNYSLAQKIPLQWKENFYQSSEFWNEKKNKTWVPYSVHEDCDCAKGWCESKVSEPQQNKALVPQFFRADIETLKGNNANGIVRISKINSALSVFLQIYFYWFLKDCWCLGCTIAAGAKFNWWIKSIFK